MTELTILEMTPERLAAVKALADSAIHGSKSGFRMVTPEHAYTLAGYVPDLLHHIELLQAVAEAAWQVLRTGHQHGNCAPTFPSDGCQECVAAWPNFAPGWPCYKLADTLRAAGLLFEEVADDAY